MNHEPPGCIGLLLKLLFPRPNERSQQTTKNTDSSETFPYSAKATLLTPTEVRFYKTLRRLLGSKYQIAICVRIADLLSVGKETPNWRRYFNRINSKHIDFVLYDPETTRPIIAIELDDSSHAKKKRQERDEFVNKAFNVAGLPLLRVLTAANYDAAELAEKLKSTIAATRRNHS